MSARERLAFPHLQTSEVRTVNVPASRGVMAHQLFLVTTACGKEKATTLTTTDPARVRCPACKAARRA